MGTYKDLFVYKKSIKAAVHTYKLTCTLPKYLQYDIADDLRRAARSIPSNIAEGYGRNKSHKDIKNFLKTSLGSCDEVLFNYTFLAALKLIDADVYSKHTSEYRTVGVGIRKLIDSLTQQTEKT